MKFKTIIMTRRTLTLTAAAILGMSASMGAFLAVKNKSIPTFEIKEETYSQILKDGLPNAEGFSLDLIKNKLLGFDIDKPETIIGKYSAAFGGTTPQRGDDAAEEAVPTAEPASETEPPAETHDQPAEPPQLPTHEQICSSLGLKLNNATAYNINVDDLCAEELAIKPDSDDVQVLVMHTHTTECYMGDEMNGETERTTDDNKNVIAVGREICAVLESYGIKTLHDTTYHDYPSYQGSYTRAMSTIDARLKEHPSIKAVLDIHRDAFVYSDGSRLRVACDQNGTETAQVMLVTGTNSMGLWHDNWKENLKFAAKIQNSAEIMNPGMMRPINLRTERFNGHMTLGSLILEVGSNGNTLEEAKEGGRNVARAIAAALING